MRSESYLSQLGRRLCQARDGSVLLFVAISLGTLLTAAGVAIEMSKYTKAKAKFEHALDQALLAAAAAQTDNPEDYAMRYLQTNLQQDGLSVNVSQFDVSYNAAKTEWTAHASGSIETSFSSLLGVGALDFDHDVKVVWDSKYKTELVAMVDVSGTMCANFSRNVTEDGSYQIDFVPDRSCKKLNMVKDALYNIADIGVGYNPTAIAAASYKVGIVPFSFKVRLPHPENAPSLLTSAESGIDPTYYTLFADAELNGPPLPGVLPLTPVTNAATKQQLLDKIQSLSSPDNGEFARPFMKRSSLGAQISGLLLDPRYHSVFGGEMPASFDDPLTKKVVIMMTDSANLGCCFTNWPEGNFRNHYIYSYMPDHQALVSGGGGGICKQMKDAGVEVYTILLDVDRRDMDARGEEIVDAFLNCATDDAHAFEIPAGDTARLKDAYSAVGKAIIRLRIAE